MAELNSYINIASVKRIRYVNNTSELNHALTEVQPGDTIILNNGLYTDDFEPIQNKKGTPEAAVRIMAANNGMAEIGGQSGLYFENCSHIILEGLKITASGMKYPDDITNVLWFKGCNNMRITRCHFQVREISEKTTYVLISGEDSHHNRIDRNLFEGKHKSGLILDITGGLSQVSQYDLIEYNYFKDNTPKIDNGKETVRIGLSRLSPTSSFSVIQYNLFEDCSGEPEIISIKACDTEVRYNTFRNSRGQVVLRHGDRSNVYGNYFIAFDRRPDEGGIRVYGNDHRIYNNYMEGLTDCAVQIDKGNAHTTGKLTAAWTPRRLEVCFNTIIDCAESIQIGKRYIYDPEDCIIANNIVTGSTGYLLHDYTDSRTTIFKGNLVFPKETAIVSNTNRLEEDAWVVDPLFIREDGIQRISSSSPAIGNAVDGFSYVTEDINRHLRKAVKDIGAQEYNGQFMITRPLEPKDVGLDAADGKIKIVIVGDSTASNYGDEVAPRTGWGQILHRFFTEKVIICNHAAPSRSTKSFIDEGRLEAVVKELRAQDYIFIQFGHNDEKKEDPNRYTEPFTTFKKYLLRYIEEARKVGAQPILLTPVERRSFSEDGSFMPSHGEYPKAMVELSAELDVPLIDITSKSQLLFSKLGEEETKSIFLCFEPGESSNYPNGVQDNVHFQLNGAIEICKLIIEGLREMDHPLNELLNDMLE